MCDIATKSSPNPDLQNPSLMPMVGRSKRTAAPAPVEITSVGAPTVAPPGAQPLPPSAIPSMLGPGAWCPSQSAVPSSSRYWFAGPQHPTMVGSSAQGPWWPPVGHGPSANLAPKTDTLGDSNPQAWYAFSTILVD
jgi:hypothetical protein